MGRMIGVDTSGDVEETSSAIWGGRYSTEVAVFVGATHDADPQAPVALAVRETVLRVAACIIERMLPREPFDTNVLVWKFQPGAARDQYTALEVHGRSNVDEDCLAIVLGRDLHRELVYLRGAPSLLALLELALPA